MTSLVQLVKCGAINAKDPNKMIYYVIQYLSEPYTLREDQAIDVKVSKTGAIVVKDEYLSSMKSKTN